MHGLVDHATTLASYLQGLALPMPVLLLVLTAWRSHSMAPLWERLWSLAGGSGVPDPAMSRYLDERASVVAFRFRTRLAVDTAAQAHAVIDYMVTRDIGPAALRRCGRYFDASRARICIERLPAPGMLRRWQARGLLALGLSCTVMLVTGATTETCVRLRDTGTWLLLDADGARLPGRAQRLHREDCLRGAASAAARPAAHGFSSRHVRLLCHVLADRDLARQLREAKRVQDAGGAALALVLSLPCLILFGRQRQARCAQALLASDEVQGGGTLPP